MDTYFFDNPKKAILKAMFLLVTYFGSIVFKQFAIPIVLPTVLIYFLSNISDYIELAFMRVDKVKKIRIASLWIFLAMALIAVLTFCIYTTDNTKIQAFADKIYYVFYILCISVWAIPLIDGIRGQFDEIRNSSEIVSKQMTSDRAFQVMNQSVSNKKTPQDSEQKS